MRFLLLLFILPTTCFALSFKVNSPKLQYQIAISSNEVVYESAFHKINMTATKCSKKHFTKFHQKLNRELNRKVLSKKSNLKLQFNKENYLIENESPLGISLIKMENILAELQLAIRSSCV